MAYQRFSFEGIKGVLKDRPPSETPKDFWTDANNVMFYQGQSQLAAGYSQIFEGNTEAPTWAIGRVEENIPFWYYGSATKLSRTEGATHTDTSRAVGGAYTSGDWNGCVLNGVVVANNSTDQLQVLEGGASTFSDSASFPTNVKAGVVRSFNNYLFALDLTIAGDRFPYAIRWSDAADPGLEPGSWDITDPAVDAGQTQLADTPGNLVDAVKLRDQLVIYKTDSVWSAQLVGGTFVFSFRKLFDNIGALGRDCAVTFEGKHFVVGLDDIYVHDGVNQRTVVEGKIRDYFFSTINEEFVRNVKVVPYYKYNEIWVLFPTTGGSVSGECDKALVWNWVQDRWSIRDIPAVRYAAFGIIDPQADTTWDGATSSWDGAGNIWDSNLYNPANTSILLLSEQDSAFYGVSEVSSYDGALFDWYLEKESFDFGNAREFKYVNSVVPIVTGSGTFEIEVGTKDRLGDGISWSSPVQFDIGNDFRAYFRKQGRFCSFRFSGNSDTNIRLFGFEVEGTLEGSK